jgi:hypothetical protein
MQSKELAKQFGITKFAQALPLSYGPQQHLIEFPFRQKISNRHLLLKQPHFLWIKPAMASMVYAAALSG